MVIRLFNWLAQHRPEIGWPRALVLVVLGAVGGMTFTHAVNWLISFV